MANAATSKSAGKLGKVGGGGARKVTHHELRLQADAERREQAAEADKRKAAARREVDEDEYARMVEVENRNRVEGEVEARSMEAALAALAMDDKGEVDRHPERYGGGYYQTKCMGMQFLCIWAHIPCVYGHTFPVYMGTHSLCIWAHIPCVYGHTFPVYMGTHSLCIWAHILCVYGHTFPVYMGTHSLCIWASTTTTTPIPKPQEGQGCMECIF